MEDKEEYKTLISEIIKKQSVILGPQIAVMKARSIEGLVVTDDGAVTDITQDPKIILQKLVNSYVELSGEIVKNALSSIFSKYPAIDCL